MCLGWSGWCCVVPGLSQEGFLYTHEPVIRITLSEVDIYVIPITNPVMGVLDGPWVAGSGVYSWGSCISGVPGVTRVTPSRINELTRVFNRLRRVHVGARYMGTE